MGYFACPVCEQSTISNLQDLQKRITTALSSSIACPICSSNQNGLSNLHSHLLSHMSLSYSNSFSDRTPFPMEQIPAIEKLEIRDEWQRSEVNARPIHHNCDLCGLVFSSEYFLNIHQEILHSNSDAFEISCKLCKSKFQDLERYRNHVNAVHSGERHFCQECPKSFKVRGGLLVHTRVFHDKNSPTYCTMCKKSFTNKTRKVIHDEKYHSSRPVVDAPVNSSVSFNNSLQTNGPAAAQLTVNESRTSYRNQNISQNNMSVNTKRARGSALLIKEKKANCTLRYENIQEPDTSDINIMLETSSGDLPDMTLRATNLENPLLYKIQHDNELNVDINSSSNSPPVQRNFANSMPIEISTNYQNMSRNLLDFNTPNGNCPDLFQGAKNFEECTTSPVINSTLSSTASSNPDLFASHANLERDDSKLLELLLWSNNSPSNANFNILSTNNISFQSQSSESDSIPFRKEICDLVDQPKPQTQLVQETNLNREEEPIILTPSPKSAEQTNSPQSKADSPKSNDNKTWQCEECKKSFTTKYFLKKHKRLHTGETPYSCAECGKTFTFQQSYHKHVFYHTNDKPHRCPQCGRCFKEMSTLHNHIRIHTGEKPFVCASCGKAFRQRVSYLVHQRIHTGHMPYSCETCKRTFRYKVSLRSHKCLLMPEQQTSNHNTATCDQLSPSCAPSENPASIKVAAAVRESSCVEDIDPMDYMSSNSVTNTACSGHVDPMSTDFDKDLFIHNLLS